jgi:hypothetical protein
MRTWMLDQLVSRLELAGVVASAVAVGSGSVPIVGGVTGPAEPEDTGEAADGRTIGSMAANSLSASARKLSCRTLNALRRANFAKVSGSCWSTGHLCPVDQDRDHADVTLQGGCDLQADDVVGVVQAPSAVLIGGAEPGWPMTATNTSQALTASVMTSAKSIPRAMVSTSMKTWSSPRWDARRS